VNAAREASSSLPSFDPDVLPHRDDGLALLTNDAMRARRRPWAIVWMWGWESVAAFVVAYPAAMAVRSVYGAHPHGDAALWNPGGLELLDLLMSNASAGASIFTLLGVVLLVASVLGVIPLAALLASIAFVTRDRQPPPIRNAFARGASAFPTMLALMGITLAVQLVLLFLGTLAGIAMNAVLIDRAGEARADQLGVLAAMVFVATATALGVAHDLARAAAVRFRVGARRAARMGLNTFRRAPVSISFSWAWRAAASLVPIIVGSVVAERVGLRGGGALFALFVVHQLVIGSRIALRASWLAKTLRAVDHAHRVVRVEA
jgi:hypothetical protein